MMSDESTEPAPPGRRGVSESLRLFVGELPTVRASILEFVSRVAGETEAGARVLDVGAGDAPYRELFAHTDYRTNDWENSPHAGAARVDVVGSASALPVPDASFDLVLMTEVLEHAAEPTMVLRECLRILAAGGRLALTVPFLWELHELPHDYYRFTEPGLRHQMSAAGFTDVVIVARGDGFAAIAQLCRNLRWRMGTADDGRDQARIEAGVVLGDLASQLDRLSPLDVSRIMPLGYAATARKPLTAAGQV